MFSDVVPNLFAVGSNLVSLRFTGNRADNDDELLVQKLEVQVESREEPDGS